MGDGGYAIGSKRYARFAVATAEGIVLRLRRKRLVVSRGVGRWRPCGSWEATVEEEVVSIDPDVRYKQRKKKGEGASRVAIGKQRWSRVAAGEGGADNVGIRCGPLAIADEGWSVVGWRRRSWSCGCGRCGGPFLLGHQQAGWGIDVGYFFEDVVHGLLDYGIVTETLRIAALIPDDKNRRVLS
ncbi:hypothetical protein B296_00022700 [Ensete ventricosum]|uniref:Uncharacterized protein n=1 Tax=Ensete ventricosum TaxID=4639 RepID=A0A427AGY6_ENSVE|nr:hypothetical protein B296_00022700 [Ensete ventricosum]